MKKKQFNKKGVNCSEKYITIFCSGPQLYRTLATKFDYN